MQENKTQPKILTILGARPQFIKAAVVSPVLSEFCKESILHTGQHFDTNMSDIFFKELSMPAPEYHLNIHGGSHGDMTGRMLMEIEKIIIKDKPDLVLVYGDTNSTLAGALAAVKCNIPIAHIEAGVRSYNRKMPEEINRVLTDQVSDLYFVTSKQAATNLLQEGCKTDNIHIVGDVMFDLALKTKALLNKDSALENKQKDYILVTLHRSENTDNENQLKKCLKLIEKISTIKPIVWVMHPRTEKALKTFNLNIAKNNIHCIEPQGYLEMMQLVQNASAVATDSGGLQKEAFYFKKPCISLRTETEWVELIDAGWNFVLGQEGFQEEVQEKTFEKMKKFLDTDFSTKPHSEVYGSGDAANKIGKILNQWFTSRN